MPIHGEYRHLIKQGDIAKKLGMPGENIFIMGNGNVLEFENADTPIRMEQVEAGNILVDGLGVGDVGNIVLRDRRHLATDGLIIVVMATSSSTGKLLSGPDVISRGFVYMRESEDMISNIREVAYEAFNKNEDGGPRRRHDWNSKKGIVRDAIHAYVYEKTKRNPMILPIIVEINPDAHGYDEESLIAFDEE
jgi:ribonuclease J